MALEDKNQRVQIYGLIEQQVESPKEMKSIIDFANRVRTTHNTVTNETSSRSHAICNFIIKIQNQNYEKEYAKLSLVDLAGSERATETQSNDKNRLAEGAEINKSLLALKECIRALDARKAKGNNEHHVPFRNSKLTLVLRDSFLGKDDLCRIIMISCISPSNHSANHTINTLRYSMRLKEKVPSSANSNIRRQMDNKKLVKNKVINLNKNKIAHPPPFIYKEVQNTDLSAVASTFSFLLSKIQTSFPSFLTSFHHLRPTKNLPLIFLVIQKSTEPKSITDKYINPFCLVKNEIII